MLVSGQRETRRVSKSLRTRVFEHWSLQRKLISGVRLAAMVRRAFKVWEAETAEFLKETGKRGQQFLHPDDGAAQ